MRRHLSAPLVAIMVLVATVVSAAPAAGTSGEMVITSDTTLTADHTGNIVIDADDVTLDCAGHSVTAMGSEREGVFVHEHSGVTVANCRVSGFEEGIQINFSDDAHVHSNIVDDARDGINVQNSNRVVVVDNVVVLDRGGAAFLVHRVQNSRFESNLAHVPAVFGDNYFGEGFGVSQADNSTFLDNEVVLFGEGDGFWWTESDGNVIADNTVLGHTGDFEHTFALWGSSNNRIERNWAPPFLEYFAFQISEVYFGYEDGSEEIIYSQNNVIVGNVAHLNGRGGFLDTNPGDGTAGTANHYADNLCIDIDNPASDPAGLCDRSGSFSDDDLNTFEFAIEWLAWTGITKGCNPPANDQFCPGEYVTRGQMAAFLHRALRDGLTPTRQVDYVDDDASVFEADIEWLGGTGVTKGCNPPTNDRFCPEDFVTRGQMAAFLVRAMGYSDDGGGDLFVDDDGSTFEDDIDRLGAAGVTKGCNPPTNDRFCPDEFVTRGQMAAFLQRALD